MSESTTTVATESTTVTVLLTYADGEDYAFVDLFHTKEQAIQHVVDAVKKYFDEIHWEEDIADDDYDALENEQEEARKSLEENDMWHDRDGNTYVLETKDYTA